MSLFGCRLKQTLASQSEEDRDSQAGAPVDKNLQYGAAIGKDQQVSVAEGKD